MILVADTNILFSYFWKNSVTRRIIQNQKLQISSPEYALEEINDNRKDIMRKTRLSGKDFKSTRIDLAIYIDFLPLKEYSGFLKDAIAFSPDQNDIDFFALALKMKVPLWSNDSGLKKQGKVRVMSTKDLLNSTEFTETMLDG